MITALVVHPEPLVRQYIRTCLGSEATFVGEAAASEDAAAQIAETHPDVVLADLLLLEENGFQLAHRLRCESPGSITVLLTDAAETALPYLNRVGRANGARAVLPYAALSERTLGALAA
jgi:DNA-binding NarL/FixJ family response regulator